MPPLKNYLRGRAKNFSHGVKRAFDAIQSLSPRKRRKGEEDKENEASTSPSDVLLDASDALYASDAWQTDPAIPDVFSATYPASHSSPAAETGDLPGSTFFYLDTLPPPPTCAPAQFVHEYSLPPPPPPKSRRATVEEAPEEDDVSYLGRLHAYSMSVDSLQSFSSDLAPDPEAEGFARASTAEPAAQEKLSSIHDPYIAPGQLRQAPTLVQAVEAVKDIAKLLRGESRGISGGYKDPHHNPFVRFRLEGMRNFLNLYIDPRSKTHGCWCASALQAAVAQGRSSHFVRTITKLARQFIHDRTILPVNPYGKWQEDLLADEALKNDVGLFLLENQNHITAEKLVEYLSRAEVMELHGIDRKISVRTARRYLRSMGYRYREAKKGQYSDGHERADVVYERDHRYIPAIRKLQGRMWQWDRDGKLHYGPMPRGRRVMVWYQDESIFYAHDRKRKNWYHPDAAAKLLPKGEGLSHMVSDYVCVDVGWSPTSLDGKRTARRYLKPGKNREGYMTCEDVCEQAEELMDILDEVCPDYEHVIVYDNATTHRKRPDGSLSARKMPRNTPKLGTNWLVEVNEVDSDGNVVHAPNGKYNKVKIRMKDTEFDGQPQSLYFPDGHPRAGVFKGMAIILEERGINAKGKLAECTKFKCAPGATDCCCRRILFNQPDFVDVKSILETTCEARGFSIIFLPKFHCELNFIEQCWGYSKRVYRLFPLSSKEVDLERNVRDALAAVPLDMMRRFGNRSSRFVDAYAMGLNGRQAAWAARKYRGHRIIPASIMRELEVADIY